MTQPGNISQDILSEAREKHVLAKPQSQRQVFNMVNIPNKEKSATTMKSNEPDQSNQPPHRAIWKPPPWPILKVNSDDAIFREQNFVDVVLDMGGGLVLFWRSTINVIVEGSSTNYIDTMFQEEDRARIGVIIRECQGKGLAHMVGKGLAHKVFRLGPFIFLSLSLALCFSFSFSHTLTLSHTH